MLDHNVFFLFFLCLGVCGGRDVYVETKAHFGTVTSLLLNRDPGILNSGLRFSLARVSLSHLTGSVFLFLISIIYSFIHSFTYPFQKRSLPGTS